MFFERNIIYFIFVVAVVVYFLCRSVYFLCRRILVGTKCRLRLAFLSCNMSVHSPNFLVFAYFTLESIFAIHTIRSTGRFKRIGVFRVHPRKTLLGQGKVVSSYSILASVGSVINGLTCIKKSEEKRTGEESNRVLL